MFALLQALSASRSVDQQLNPTFLVREQSLEGASENGYVGAYTPVYRPYLPNHRNELESLITVQKVT